MDSLDDTTWAAIQQNLNDEDLKELKGDIKAIFNERVPGIKNCGDLIFEEDDFSIVKEKFSEIVTENGKKNFVNVF